ncbi:hypothetical protein CLOSTMETH_03472 [[Clostridium] methylpentosum DSM 5476]|uniref:Uncharacterized protein n=1 Tax=[Clostridium] methylpentosum DSM 5476 TaxID=537013 RepID=C0EHX7_9FIRM|nr:hypothetical protein CLOSTMETH_03472 [[Clostridium] methylpentosum DSM 5476]
MAYLIHSEQKNKFTVRCINHRATSCRSLNCISVIGRAAAVLQALNVFAL